MKAKQKTAPGPDAANQQDVPARNSKAPPPSGRGQPVDIKTRRSYGDPKDALPIDFGPDYQPGDVFAHVFAGLPGHEHVEAPVRRKAKPGAAKEPANTEAVAAAGVQGPAQKLPHLDAIQKSFGSKDVSNIKAHVGGPAAAAATELGAEAYAVGDSVAFKEQPDLHTAAHEAAHVVQATGQVKFKKKSSKEGDSDEKQADKVADKVVAGQSVEPNLQDDIPYGSYALDAGKTPYDVIQDCAEAIGKALRARVAEFNGALNQFESNLLHDDPEPANYEQAWEKFASVAVDIASEVVPAGKTVKTLKQVAEVVIAAVPTNSKYADDKSVRKFILDFRQHIANSLGNLSMVIDEDLEAEYTERFEDHGKDSKSPYKRSDGYVAGKQGRFLHSLERDKEEARVSSTGVLQQTEAKLMASWVSANTTRSKHTGGDRAGNLTDGFIEIVLESDFEWPREESRRPIKVKSTDVTHAQLHSPNAAKLVQRFKEIGPQSVWDIPVPKHVSVYDKDGALRQMCRVELSETSENLVEAHDPYGVWLLHSYIAEPVPVSVLKGVKR